MRCLAGVAVVLLANVAHAAPPGLTQSETPVVDPELTSYRSQTLIADGVAVGLFALASDTNDAKGLLQLSAGTYLLGAPLVHASKGRWRRGLASVGMRVGFPVLGALLFDSLRPKPDCIAFLPDDSGRSACEPEGPSEELMLGLVVGLIAASAADTLFLADVDVLEPAPRLRATVKSVHNGLALGLGGSF